MGDNMNGDTMPTRDDGPNYRIIQNTRSQLTAMGSSGGGVRTEVKTKEFAKGDSTLTVLYREDKKAGSDSRRRELIVYGEPVDGPYEPPGETGGSDQTETCQAYRPLNQGEQNLVERQWTNMDRLFDKVRFRGGLNG